jgi:ribonuclease Z
MDTLDYHTSPVDAAAAANEANAGMLVFSHYAPVPQNQLVERIFMRGVDHVRPDGVVMATDGTHIELPALDDGENDEKRQIILNQPKLVLR